MIFSPYIIYAGFVLVIIIMIVWIAALELRLKKVFRGKKLKDMEEVLRDMGKDLDSIQKFRNELSVYLESVEKRLTKSIRKVHTLRFNPFENSGSNQSFATTFLDDEGDGVVISTLYSREKVGVYAKPIRKYTSEYPLSEEENHVIKSARGKSDS